LTATADTSAVITAGRPIRGGRRLPLTWIGVVPFLAYIGLFLLLPTVIVIAGAFVDKNGNVNPSELQTLTQQFVVKAYVQSLLLSLVSALGGAVAGALLAYVIVLGNPQGLLRRTVTSAAGVLAQFGGVTLAFAFVATIGGAGFLTVFLQDRGINIYPNGIWLYDLPGLVVVYLYFQIPLMVLVFLPALDGVRPQWREATESLGGNAWHYWRFVAGPLLFPAFLGATLLLFANAFSAYATAAALINQGNPIVPLAIGGLIQSEVGLSDPGQAKALALGMVVIVAIVMVSYSLLQRRTARWLQ
jgi:putative spermidine/putrescine transport system permease protein